MKNKILKKVTDWYKSQEENQDVQMPEELLGLLIDKIAEAIFDEVKVELKNEFDKGNLKQPFFISDEYYLYLKLKEIKNNISKIQEPSELENYYSELKEDLEE